MKVLCGSPCGKTPVFDGYYDAIARLETPPDSIKIRVVGGSIPLNLNKLVDEATKHECSHLFIVEDDSEFASDTLTRLLAHDKPVVAGLCRSRQAPFRPYVYSGVDEGGLVWRPLTPKDNGLIKVAATGMGGILINMTVFDKLSRPYFRTEIRGEKEWGQDILFGESLIKAGIDVYCDLDVTIWHATQCVIGSEHMGKEWGIVVKINEATLNLGKLEERP